MATLRMWMTAAEYRNSEDTLRRTCITSLRSNAERHDRFQANRPTCPIPEESEYIFPVTGPYSHVCSDTASSYDYFATFLAAPAIKQIHDAWAVQRVCCRCLYVYFYWTLSSGYRIRMLKNLRHSNRIRNYAGSRIWARYT